MKITIIGISDNTDVWFPPQVMDIIRCGHHFSGGKRHRELVRHLLPDNHKWIDIIVPVSDVIAQYRALDNNVHLTVFASGDPLFFGYANTIQRLMPEAELEVFPHFNSLQSLAHRLLLPYQDMKMVSQTGRPWQPLDEALIKGERMIGVLTDKYKTPQTIAGRMVEYGYDNYMVHVGECLGNPEKEHISPYSSVIELLNETRTFDNPNCMILIMQGEGRPRKFAIPETEFHLLDGRAKMITKAPIRLLTLCKMELYDKKTMWDVGFCTGSVSIEARLHFPHLHIVAFEVRTEGEDLMKQNSRKFGAPGIETHIGDFLDENLEGIENPDAVFIGGHGGRIEEMVDKIYQHLLPGGVIVFNSVSENSSELFYSAIGKVGMTMTDNTAITIDDHNTIHILQAKKHSL